jgi:hypothetical protein
VWLGIGVGVHVAHKLAVPREHCVRESRDHQQIERPSASRSTLVSAMNGSR